MMSGVTEATTVSSSIQPSPSLGTHLDPFRPLSWSSVARGWSNAYEEYDYWIPTVDIEGEIPADLVGTIFRNGPGMNEVYGKRLKHHIDGDGLICSITFMPPSNPESRTNNTSSTNSKSRVHFRSRFVRTHHHLHEAYARKFLYRGQMGTRATAWFRDTWHLIKDMMTGNVTPLNYRNPSNTNVSTAQCKEYTMRWVSKRWEPASPSNIGC